MKQPTAENFHKLYGESELAMVIKKEDFLDYQIMTILSMAAVYFIFGATNPLTWLSIGLGLFMMVGFVVRHGFELTVPVIVKQPQNLIYMLMYRIENLTRFWFIAVVLLAAENYLIVLTPSWPHHVEWMRTGALTLFYVHFVGITLYRTYSFIVHLNRRELVEEVLLQTNWRKQVRDTGSITFEIVHAYVTGLLTHIILIAPWYFVITHVNFSLVLMPLVFVVDFILQNKFLKVLNAWFYRDHWVAHHSRFEFVYFHGTHHDAIPSGIIGVAGNGHLEGLARHTLGSPAPFFNPLFAALVYSFEVQGDIEAHQFIPGVYPAANMEYQKLTQHSMHHMGHLEPYGFGLNIDQPGANDAFKKKFQVMPDEIKNGYKLDEALNGYKWDNAKHKRFLQLIEKYEGESADGGENKTQEESPVRT